MKTYRIGVYEEQRGYIEIRAKSLDEATEKAYAHLEEFGMDDKVEVKDREFNTI